MSTTSIIINDRLPIPAGQHPAGLRLVALFGSVTTAFGGDGTDASLARSAWMWVDPMRLPTSVPPWVRTYAGAAYVAEYERRQKKAVKS